MTDQFTAPAQDVFMSGGGGTNVDLGLGDSITGVVLGVKVQNDVYDGKPVLWDSGEPKKVWLFELDTADGPQTLWVRGNLVKVLREATTASGFKTVVGTQITVQHHALGEKKTGKFPAKLYRAKVEAAPARAKPDAWTEEPF